MSDIAVCIFFCSFLQNISENCIGASGTRAISKLMMTNQFIQSLDISGTFSFLFSSTYTYVNDLMALLTSLIIYISTSMFREMYLINSSYIKLTTDVHVCVCVEVF